MPDVPSLGRPESSMATLHGPVETREPTKLVLCFDGTGNTFSGSNADTNVVKLLNNLDCSHPNQQHYYQTGIGTYDINARSVNQPWLGELRSSISQLIDQGLGTTFDAHVMAGYRFLMRFYDSAKGDMIYMFGFSRGAFTARFLARMVNTVGLLCKGNEEMVPFVYRLYQRYLSGKIKRIEATQPGNDTGDTGDDDTAARDEVTAFSSTFCRKEHVVRDDKAEENIKVYFLGLWDCVSSVAVLERKAPFPVPVSGTAHIVRHAVAVDERRVKFRPALLAQDIRSNSADDIQEVWFAGSHGDVGGGWPAVADEPLDSGRPMSLWQRVKNLCTTRRAAAPSRDVAADRFQMSDIPLAWMIHEVELVGQQYPPAAIKWSPNLDGFKRRFDKRKDQALGGFMHDSLRFGYGTAFFQVLLWWVLEWCPLVTRWELHGNRWRNTHFPLNKGGTRDIPLNAVLHESLVLRLQKDSDYNPQNNHGDDQPPCLKDHGRVADIDQTEPSDPAHTTFRLRDEPTTNAADTNRDIQV
ncbi:alpha/beta hydrolase [Hirsutella rhossiliensis]|uniref:Alpha/beta hydrolase domain-containing protein n=1 Tax=Hirsutella rhossiliensis TaxID=111463 RepID=A0A9P8SHA7_9HYPO|nr:alpha/beta hydrolase domain-containing protein [Hirsutella rhossiliensis]KAH0961969.1 alpha/beta hydrolase domain-containing protein [Hirsutella rhossiliensis]